jgi:mRNA interferase RelE/StbE
MPPRRRQRVQATQAGAEVWLTDPAVEDLRRLDGAALVWTLKKMLLLERDPNAGEPLLGSLIGYRKLVVGNRDWRLVWRTTTDARGSLIVDIAEVWAAGARSDAQVYDEMTARVATLADTPVRRSLSDIIEQLGRRAKGLAATAVAAPRSEPEQWLVDRLVHTAGMQAAEVLAMTSEEAVDAWTAYITRPR